MRVKQISGVYDAPRTHWVGNGFPVRTLFSYSDHGKALSPFLLLDHAVPQSFPPSTDPRGVRAHAHRGFETVTLLYQGELAHRDTTGASGTIGPGDVQWMTAGAGIVHEEFHSETFTRNGGVLEMVQLWVNLPARDKMTPPRYQTLRQADMAHHALPGGLGSVRVIAGDWNGVSGPARTFSPPQLWELRLQSGPDTALHAPLGHTLALVVLQGTVRINVQEVVRGGQLVHFERAGETVLIGTHNEALVLWLSGEPLDEPVVGYGPFVMNTQEQIDEALRELRQGRFGTMPGLPGQRHERVAPALAVGSKMQNP